MTVFDLIEILGECPQDMKVSTLDKFGMIRPVRTVVQWNAADGSNSVIVLEPEF